MPESKVGVIVGSLRQQAFTGMLASALEQLTPAGMTLHRIEIGDLPLYNQDLETDSPPATWTRFRSDVKASDGILFVTPEYNRGVPGAVKNAIDVGSRPWGHSAWNGKPAGVISLSPGALGAMAANHQLRQGLLAVNLAAMPHPEAYIPAAGSLFSDDGKLTNEDTRKFLRSFLEAFGTWIARFQEG